MNAPTPGVAEIRSALAGADRTPLAWDGYGRAAILVPVLDAPDGPALLFTVRASHLTRHGGQIAFPGGRLEPGEDAVSAALRETREEVGLDVPAEDVLGVLDDQPSPFALIATPVVARVAWPAPLELQASEVDTSFVVSLATLRATDPTWEDRVTDGRVRRLHCYEVEGRRIWGLTGNVVRELLERLAAAVDARVGAVRS
ncbi:MAG: CoA pyrophosphatase [Trueperaceae bacterium]|nr:CoA pyrophosphatase [Trueperaceae bacterium]